MIIKNHINIVKSLYYVRYELTLALLTSLLVYLVFDVAEVESFAVPNVLPVFLGPALAIFLGFRSNAAYARWGEAAQLWSAIIAQSRTFGRLICTFVESHKHVDSYDPETAIAFQKEMIYRHLAWVHALRLHLRGETSCNSWKEQVEVFLSDEDWKSVASKQNKPYALSILQGNRIYDGMRLGTLQGFDSFQLEGCLAQFSTLQAYCERIKHTPIPRQYTFFTRMFVWFFIVTIPFSLIETFAMVSRTWVS
jgi:putative membrane protein